MVSGTLSDVLGLILNVDDELLPKGSPWRTREESRHQPALFSVKGFPVYEVWFFRCGRWWCMSRSYDMAIARMGVIYFDTMAHLKMLVAKYGNQAA